MSNQPNFHVVFIATSTDEKVRDLNMIAWRKRLPIKFFNLDRLAGTLHNTTEDGENAEANASKKLEGIQSKIERFRADEAAIRKFCNTQGIPNIDMHQVWFGTEDSGITMPPAIWHHIPKEIMEVLPDEVKERVSHLPSGPNVDTAPFLSATLGAANIEHIINAGLNAYAAHKNYFVNPKDMVFTERSVLNLKPMIPDKKYKASGLDSEEPSLLGVGESRNHLASKFAVNDADNLIKISNYNLLSPETRLQRGLKTAAELGYQYVAHHSSRAKAVDDLVRQINRFVAPEHNILPVSEAQHNDLMIGIAKSPDEFSVGIINGTPDSAAPLNDRLNYEGKHLQLHLPSDEPAPAGLSDIEKARFYLSYPERILKQSDGLVFLPDSAHPDQPPMSLEEKLYLLSSVVVAKQLIQRDKDKPVVIINTDNSWTEALKIHKALSECQMTKNHVIPLGHTLPNVNIIPDGYFSIINGANTSYEAAVSAAAYLMKDASLTYHRYHTADTPVSRQGPSPYARDSKGQTPKNQVAIFCSASSENVPLNRFVANMAEKLVAGGKRIISGGGDRYTMGAILDGVVKHRSKMSREMTSDEKKQKAYIAGISTFPIVAAETNRGEMPDSYTFTELAEDIYERMAKIMVGAETLVVAPGGAGTMQEWMGVNLLKKRMPEVFANKRLVIFDPELMTRLPEAGKNDNLLDTQHSSALQNKVFDNILKFIFKDKLPAHRLQWHHSDTFVCSNVDEVLKVAGVDVNAQRSI